MVSESGPTQAPHQQCMEADCVICQWVGEAVVRFNERMQAALLASAPPPITVRRWLPDDNEETAPRP